MPSLFRSSGRLKNLTPSLVLETTLAPGWELRGVMHEMRTIASVLPDHRPKLHAGIGSLTRERRRASFKTLSELRRGEYADQDLARLQLLEAFVSSS